ncbi:MAG TPA: hypothetical protein VG096_08010 [Bryobacteraceae bacterium]|jgi:hypothetical protein|nr:hypothetical protein [Bryobacteraceae bacterium]
MIPSGTLRRRQWDGHFPERRAARRYPIEIAVVYRLLRGGNVVVQRGFGLTRNLSSTGLLMESTTSLSIGTEVEVFLAWPARLGGEVNLNLWIQGRAVRAGENCTAIAIERSDFRTRASVDGCAVFGN